MWCQNWKWNIYSLLKSTGTAAQVFLVIILRLIMSSSVWFWVKVLRPTWHKTSHFGDILSFQPISWHSTEETKSNTTTANIHPVHKCTITQNKQKNYVKPRWVASYDRQPGKRKGSILIAPAANTGHDKLRKWIFDLPCLYCWVL